MPSLRRVVENASRRFGNGRDSRHRYKQVWDRMSTTENAAKVAVQGCADDEELKRTAAYDFTRLRRGLRLDATSEVLEIGCGVGRLGTMFAPLCRTWTGCDVSPRMLEYARGRLAGFGNTRFVELSGYDLSPVLDASQDVVYSTVVFMHLTEWDRYNYISEGRRVLRPGGQLYVDNISLTTDYGWSMFESSRLYPAARRPAHIASASTPQEFEVYLARAGFASWQVEVVDNAWVVGMAIK